MFAKLIVVAFLGSVFAVLEGERQTRQMNVIPSDCSNTFQLATNPCASGQGRIYYSVPNDPYKFVQCDSLGQAYIVQCPTGLVFDRVTISCQAQQQPLMTIVTSPCSTQAVTNGQIYYAYIGDNTKFYVCTSIGQAQLLTCPQNLKWEQTRLACVYPSGTGLTVVTNQVGTSTTQFTNPCTQQQIATRRYYFAHPDPNRFIQCGPGGEAYVITCPSGLVWNQYSETCSSTFSGALVGQIVTP